MSQSTLQRLQWEWVRAFCVLCVIFFAVRAWSAPKNTPERKQSLEQRLIQKNIAISNMLDGVAEGLDLFLVGRRLTDRRNETSFRIENSTISSEGAPFNNSTGLAINLNLPNLERYWNLKFTSYDERKERRGVQQNYLRRAPRQQNYGATLGLFKKLGDVRTSFEPRIELQDPLRVSHSLTFESVATVKTLEGTAHETVYEVNPKLEFFATPDRGVGNFVALNVHIQLDEEFSLTFINEGEYEEKSHLFLVTNGFSIGQEWEPEISSISYNLMFGSKNQEVYHLSQYVFSVSWSQLIYRKILDYQLVPNLVFSEENNFKPSAGFSLNFNLNF